MGLGTARFVTQNVSTTLCDPLFLPGYQVGCGFARFLWRETGRLTACFADKNALDVGAEPLFAGLG